VCRRTLIKGDKKDEVREKLAIRQMAPSKLINRYLIQLRSDSPCWPISY